MSFAAFIQERRYLKNVSQSTISWYTHAFKWLPSKSPTEDELKNMVIRMRQAGLKETGCNAAIRAINVYLKWSKSGLKVQQLKEPKLILRTYTAAQVAKLVSWRPRGFYERRLHLLVLILLDTGARISEVLTLRVNDLDMDNLLMTLDGKGRKQRIVPFSLELRRTLFRYVKDYERKPEARLFATRTGTALGRMQALRRVKWLCSTLGFDAPPRTLHAFRHCFATFYLRRGGSVFHLQRVLGHSSLEMSRRYANLLTEDLQAIHERVSLLSIH